MLETQEYIVIFGLVLFAKILFFTFMRDPIINFQRNSRLQERRNNAALYRHLHMRNFADDADVQE